MKLKTGDAVQNNVGTFCVLLDRKTKEYKLVNLEEGFIYEHDGSFSEAYIRESFSNIQFNICEVFKKVNEK